VSERRRHLQQELKRALERLEAARFSRDPADSFGPLADALQWAVLLDGWHERHTRDYRRHRDADEGGQVLPGLRHAWNVVKHSDVETLVDVTDGAQFPMQFPVTFHEITWKPLAKLPPLPKLNPRGTQVYRMGLEDKPVRLTMYHLGPFFEQLVSDD
jgi:hypothetical protein